MNSNITNFLQKQINLFARDWAKSGMRIAILISIYVFLVSGYKWSSVEALVWIHFVLLLIHQYEEYVYPGGFKEYFNQNIVNNIPIMRTPLNDRGIFIVNVVLAWTAYFLSALRGLHFPALIFGLLGVTIMNGLLHTIVFIIKREYNPGLFSGMFLFIPFGIYFLIKMISMAPGSLLPGVLIFVVGASLIPITIWVTGKDHPSTSSKNLH